MENTNVNVNAPVVETVAAPVVPTPPVVNPAVAPKKKADPLEIAVGSFAVLGVAETTYFLVKLGVWGWKKIKSNMDAKKAIPSAEPVEEPVKEEAPTAAE